jgi:HEAT repeat protein
MVVAYLRSAYMGFWGLFKAKWKNSDPQIRLAAIKNLKDTEQKIFKELAINDTDAQVRQIAVSRLNDPFQLAEIAKNDTDSGTRLQAVAQIEDTDVLRRLMEDASDPQVVTAAANQLGDLNALLSQVKQTADTQLFTMLIDRFPDQVPLADMARQAPSEAIARLAIEALEDETTLNELKTETGVIGELAAEQLALWQEITPHIAALESPDADRRLEAATALGQMNSPRTTPALLALATASSETAKLRQAAITGLGNKGNRQAVEPLIALVKNSQESEELRAAAIEALATIGDLRAINAIGIALRTATDFISLLRRSAVKALGLLPDVQSAKILVHSLRNDDVVVQSTAVASLTAIGQAAILPLIQGLETKGVESFVRQAQLESLEKITGQKLGTDPAKWHQWLEQNAQEETAPKPA